jgi:hypothetical protein
VEEYRFQHHASVDFIVCGYAAKNNHPKVEEYHGRHHASIEAILAGYTLAGNCQKMKCYSTFQHPSLLQQQTQTAWPQTQRLGQPPLFSSPQCENRSPSAFHANTVLAGNGQMEKQYPLFLNQQRVLLQQQAQTAWPQIQHVRQPLILSSPQAGKRSPSDFHADIVIPLNKKSNNLPQNAQSVNYESHNQPPGMAQPTLFFTPAPIKTVITSELITNALASAVYPVKQELLAVKQEPEDNFIPLVNRPTPVRVFNPQEMTRVVALLRGNSTASRNCTHLAQDVMNYLRTGEVPKKPSLEADSTVDDFVYFPVSKRQEVKKESGKKSNPLLVTQASVHVGSFFQQHPIPAQLEPYIDDNIIHVEHPYVANVDHCTNDGQFPEQKVNIRSLGDKLKSKALINGGISFGYLHLECAKNGAMGHMVVYFSTEQETWYIDCQKLNGITKQGMPIYDDLSKQYKFYGLNYNLIDDRAFQQEVFLIPMAPYTRALESDNQTINNRSY